jgi:hypothetical protein
MKCYHIGQCNFFHLTKCDEYYTDDLEVTNEDVLNDITIEILERTLHEQPLVHPEERPRTRIRSFMTVIVDQDLSRGLFS